MSEYEGCTFVFDVDGTICPIKEKKQEYSDLVPYAKVIDKIRYCKEQGAKIILYTSRNMKSYQGNLGLINVHTAPTMIEWLRKWDIPYDEIYFGKVWPGECGFYVDDCSVRPDEFLLYSMSELEKICEDSRTAVKEEHKCLD